MTRTEPTDASARRSCDVLATGSRQPREWCCAGIGSGCAAAALCGRTPQLFVECRRASRRGRLRRCVS